jgi:hypothetical protein
MTQAEGIILLLSSSPRVVARLLRDPGGRSSDETLTAMALQIHSNFGCDAFASSHVPNPGAHFRSELEVAHA